MMIMMKWQCGSEWRVVWLFLFLRVLAEFQSRKAQRILLRDKDLLRYLAGILTIVFCYMVTWTVIHIGHIADGGSLLESRITADGFKYSYCSFRLWDYVMEIGKSSHYVLTTV